MKALVLDAKWEPRPDYVVSEWEKKTGKAITGSSIWRHPKLEVRTVPDPKPDPDDVLLRVKACGVCGSDIHFYEHDADDYILYPGLTKFPTTTGHEFSGEVVEVGSNVKSLKVGDMVKVDGFRLADNTVQASEITIGSTQAGEQGSSLSAGDERSSSSSGGDSLNSTRPANDTHDAGNSGSDDSSGHH